MFFYAAGVVIELNLQLVYYFYHLIGISFRISFDVAWTVSFDQYRSENKRYVSSYTEK